MPPLTRQLIAEIKSMVQGYAHVLKWNRNQPRNPSGTSAGGQWASGVSQGLHGVDVRSAEGLSRADPYETVPGMERGGGGGAGWSTLARARSGVYSAVTGSVRDNTVRLKVKGAKFKNTPRGVGLPEPPPPPPPTPHQTPALTSGEVSDVVKQFSGGVNASYLVEMDDENQTQAVLKTEAGERWGQGFWNQDITKFITNRKFSLAEREAMASEVSVGLGFEELVPETHLRTNIDADDVDWDVRSNDFDDEDGGGSGYDELAAREQYDLYVENALDKSLVQTFTNWRKNEGYVSAETARSGDAELHDPPHPHGGSLQKFIPDLQDDGDISHEDATKMAVLDYVLGSMDRHGGNLKFTNDKPVAIDNGYSFPSNAGTDNFEFRSKVTVEWTRHSDSGSLTEEMRKPILTALNTTDWKAMADQHPSMSQYERVAFLDRIEKMKVALSTESGLLTLWKSLNLTQ